MHEGAKICILGGVFIPHNLPKLVDSTDDGPELSRLPIFTALDLVGRSNISLGNWSPARLSNWSPRDLYGGCQVARDRVHKLITDLKAACLLFDGDKNGYVKMHDVVRDAALSIASRSQCIFTFRDATGLKEWPNQSKLRACTRIYLPSSGIEELPERMECSDLEFLVLGNGDYYRRNPNLGISDSFFERISKLRVLEFGGMILLSLPQSLGFQTNLCAMCLKGCVLGDIAVIGELKSLEMLSLCGSEVEQLPREIGQLTRLKLLDLSMCRHLKVIPANVISRLSLLEELYMLGCCPLWAVEGINNPSNASLAEVVNLSRLKILEIEIPDAKMLLKRFL